MLLEKVLQEMQETLGNLELEVLKETQEILVM
jgi:hypothetical protein